MSMIQNPLVSVVLAVHKESPYFSLALQSLINQSLKEIEIIIVANGCTKKYLEKLKIYLASLDDSRIILVELELGQHSFSLNYGAITARSNFIARMDYDDVCHEDRLKIQYEFMFNNPDVGILGTSINYIDHEGKFLRSKLMPLSNDSIRKKLPFTNPFCHPSVMLRKSEILKLSGYSGGMFSEDYGLWIRASRNKLLKFRNLDDKLLNYRLSNFQSRGMRVAYAEVAGLLFAESLYRKSFIFFIGSIYSSLKIFLANK